MRSRGTYISLDMNVGAFEFLIVQLLNGNFQITSGLKLHKPEDTSAADLLSRVRAYPLPSRSRPTSE